MKTVPIPNVASGLCRNAQSRTNRSSDKMAALAGADPPLLSSSPHSDIRDPAAFMEESMMVRVLSVTTGLILVAALSCASPALAAAPGGGVDDVAPAAIQADTAGAGFSALRVNITAPVGPAELDRYVGYYQLTRYALLHIYRVGDGLRLAYPRAEQDDVQLVAQGGTTFLAPEYTRPQLAKAEMRQAEGRVTFKLDANGNATGLVLQVLGRSWPAPKLERDKAYSVEWQLRQRVNLQIESAGTREFLERFLRSVEAGAPDYSGMTPRLAASEKRGQDVAKISSLGPLKKIFFVVVTNEGSDRYTAVFAHSRIDFLVPPLDTDGKVPDLVLRQSLPIYVSSGIARQDGVGRVFIDKFIAPPPVPLDLK